MDTEILKSALEAAEIATTTRRLESLFEVLEEDASRLLQVQAEAGRLTYRISSMEQLIDDIKSGKQRSVQDILVRINEIKKI